MRHEERAEQVFNSLQYMGPERSMEYLTEQFREVATEMTEEKIDEIKIRLFNYCDMTTPLLKTENQNLRERVDRLRFALDTQGCRCHTSTELGKMSCYRCRAIEEDEASK